VDLIAFQGEEQAPDLKEIARWCNKIFLVERPSSWQTLLRKTWAAVTGRPVFVSSYGSQKMREAIETQLRRRQYDVVVFQQTEMAQFRPSWYKGLSVLSMENPMVLSHQRLMESSTSWYSRCRFQNRVARLKRYEQRQTPLFDRVLLINEADVNSCRNILPNARLDWVPHGVDIEMFRPRETCLRRKGMIIITGNMYHPPNVEAVEYFCREVFPIVRKRAPSANLWLVGADPVLTIKRCADADRIIVTGFVPDIQTYLTQAKVSVCPVRLRIGTQTKILEALACGTPVVTTSAGNNGLGAVSGKHLYVADDPREMADRVVTLLKGEGWSTLSENGRRFVVDNFAWEKGIARFENILKEVLKESGRGEQSNN
jgi:glycosyltransferase involved in cell wall biosynthesis